MFEPLTVAMGHCCLLRDVWETMKSPPAPRPSAPYQSTVSDVEFPIQWRGSDPSVTC